MRTGVPEFISCRNGSEGVQTFLFHSEKWDEGFIRLCAGFVMEQSQARSSAKTEGALEQPRVKLTLPNR